MGASPLGNSYAWKLAVPGPLSLLLTFVVLVVLVLLTLLMSGTLLRLVLLSGLS